MRISVALALFVAAFPINPAVSKDSDLSKTLGLKPGQKYTEAKGHLVKTGWVADRSYGEKADNTSYGFKEVVCGEGRMAVCSARFTQRERQILLTLQPKKELVVEGAWDDK